jgi:hypothetical protein
MIDLEVLCIGIAELVPLFGAIVSFIYGLKHFFKKGKPLFLQTITMAMGSHALSSIYHLCQSLTSDVLIEGFTPAYLGRIGFFLFFITASYGQMDRIVDDDSSNMKRSRWIALLAPICAVLLYIPNGIIQDVPIQTKVVYGFVWLPAVIAVYFNLKHAMIPDMDFGFIKAMKPYNIFALCLCFSELICLTAWDYYYMVPLAVSSVIFGVLSICTMVAAKRGAEQWTI